MCLIYLFVFSGYRKSGDWFVLIRSSDHLWRGMYEEVDFVAVMLPALASGAVYKSALMQTVRLRSQIAPAQAQKAG